MKISTMTVAAALAATALAGPARAVTWTLIDKGGAAVGSEARKGFDMATSYWSSILTDDINIVLTIGYESLGAGILGSTGSTQVVVLVDDTYEAIAADSSSALDASAVDNLQPLTISTDAETAGYAQLDFVANSKNRANTAYLDTSTRVDSDGSINNIALSVNLANAAALDLEVDANGWTIDYTQSAAEILFSPDFEMDFDASDGIDDGAFDFVGIAIHEIGHALGFVSGVDAYDAYTYPGNWTNRESNVLEGYAINGTLDLYRYSAAGTLDLSTSASDKYFSIDGGETQLFGDSRFSTGTENGDGSQASHWKDSAGNDQLGVLDPTAGTGQVMEVTALDLAAFDAIGWDVSFDVLANSDYVRTTADIYAAAIPEPATWVQMLFGFALLGGVIRRRRRALVAA